MTKTTTSQWGRTGSTPAPAAAPGSGLWAKWPGAPWEWSVSVTGVCTSLRPDTTRHGWPSTPSVARKITLICLRPVGWQWRKWRRQRTWLFIPGVSARIITRTCNFATLILSTPLSFNLATVTAKSPKTTKIIMTDMSSQQKLNNLRIMETRVMAMQEMASSFEPRILKMTRDMCW